MTDQSDGISEPVSLRRFLSDTAVYGLVDVSDKAIGFVLLPIMTRILLPADYGLLGIFGTSSGVLLLLYSMGMLNGFFRFYTATDDSVRQRRILSTTIWITAATSLGWSALLYVLARELDEWLFRGDGSGFVLMLGVLTYLRFIHSLGTARLQADGNRRTFVCLSMLQTVSTRLTGVVLVVYGYGVWGWLWGEFLGQTMVVALLALTGLRGARVEFSRPDARDMFPFSVSLVPAALSHWLMTCSDMYLLKLMTTLSEVGLYSVGQRISSIMQLINTAFILGWRRFAFRNIHHPEGPQLVARGTTLFVLIGGYCSLALCLLGDDLTYWVISPRFFDGMTVIVPLTLATFVWGLADIVSIGLLKSNRTLLLSWLNVLAAVVNISLNLLLIPRYGIVGAATATLISQLLKTALVWRSAHHSFPVPYEYSKLAVILTVFPTVLAGGHFSGQILTARLSDNAGWLAAGLIQGGLLILVPLVVWFSGFFTDYEKQRIRELLFAWRRSEE